MEDYNNKTKAELLEIIQNLEKKVEQLSSESASGRKERFRDRYSNRILDNLPDMLTVLDRDANIVELVSSPSTNHVEGTTADSITQSNIKDILPEDAYKNIRKNMEQVFHSGKSAIARHDLMMDGVPHHLVDVLDPSEDFNVVLFQQMAKEAMEGIYQRGHIPIVVGGTGFYIQALLYDIGFTENNADTAYREELEALAKTQGAEYLHEMLEKVDPESAEQIHFHNIKRVIRALEYYEQTGEKISAHNEAERAKTSPYHFFYYVLNTDRTVLYERIEKRIDEMMEEGLVEEVRQLQAMGCRRDSVAMQGLGYKEILAYLNGEMSLETAVNILKRDTRHFAKRQLTWFRRERDVRFLYLPEFDNDRERVLEHILQELAAEAGIMECDS